MDVLARKLGDLSRLNDDTEVSDKLEELHQISDSKLAGSLGHILLEQGVRDETAMSLTGMDEDQYEEFKAVKEEYDELRADKVGEIDVIDELDHEEKMAVDMGVGVVEPILETYHNDGDVIEIIEAAEEVSEKPEVQMLTTVKDQYGDEVRDLVEDKLGNYNGVLSGEENESETFETSIGGNDLDRREKEKTYEEFLAEDENFDLYTEFRDSGEEESQELRNTLLERSLEDEDLDEEETSRLQEKLDSELEE